MVYDSVYEANNYLRGTARNQRFWEYFSGSKLQEFPTYTDDFSSDGWTDSDSTYIGVSGGSMNWNCKRDGTNDASTYDLTSTSANWVLRFKLKVTNVSASTQAGNGFYVGLSDSNQTAGQSTSQDFIGVSIYNDNTDTYRTIDADGSALPAIYQGDSSQSTTYNTNSIWYYEIIKTGSSYTVEAFSGSDYSTGSEGKITGSSDATGLRYLKVLNDMANIPTSTNPFQGTIDDLKFYNGVSTPSGRWTTNDITGTGTFEMADEADGGFKIITSTSSTAKQSITFNDIRQYDPTASEVIMILKRITDDGGINGNFNAGLSNGSTTYPSHSVVVTNYRNDTYYSLSSTASTGVSRSASTTPTDTAWHTHKLINGSSDLKLNIDGVLGVTRTAHRPIIEMQPIVYSNSTSLASETRVRYFEAYNT